MREKWGSSRNTISVFIDRLWEFFFWHARRKSPSDPGICGNGNERREEVYLVECERSGPHLEIPYLFLLTDCECGTRNLSTSFFPLRRAQNEAGMAGSTTESVGASTAEISGVFGRGVVENESLAAFGEVKCAGRSGGSGKGRHGFAARGAARGVVE